MSSTLQQFYPQSLCVECVLWGFGFAPPTVQENPIRFIEHSYLTMFVNVSVNGCVRKTFLLVILSVFYCCVLTAVVIWGTCLDFAISKLK